MNHSRRPRASRRARLHSLVLALALSSVVGGCTDSGDNGQPAPAPQPFVLGSAISGLTPSEQAAFDRGKLVFEREFKPSEGLGPHYNSISCKSCHSVPTSGGSARLYRNFYIVRGDSPGQINLLDLVGPVMPAFGTGSHMSATFSLTGGRHVIPTDFFGGPITVAQRNALPIFGVGLFEFVSNATILANADPNDLDGDGISGRFNTEAGRIGRFGVKSQANNIESFTRAPLQNQMGITSDPFLGAGAAVSFAASANAAAQGTASPDAPTSDSDGVPDPEISAQDLGDLIAFTTFLAPPRKKPFSLQAMRGDLAFKQLGCVKCHIPSLDSSRGPVEAYTDLLLHDMGDDLMDNLSFGTPQPGMGTPFTTAREFRTQPLWGVSLTAPFLHDGRAETLDEAIRMHGGEAAAIRDAYVALTQNEREDIIAFLEHL